MIECSWKSTFGFECLTCGFQRSFEALLHGELSESFYLFPATIPLLIVFIGLPIHLIFQIKHGAKALVFLFSFAAFLIVANYIGKLGSNSDFHQHSFKIHHQF